MNKIILTVLLIILPLQANALKPTDSPFPGFHFNKDGRSLFIGMFSINNPSFPDIYFVALLADNGSKWVNLDERQPMWADQQEDFTPQLIADLIIRDFNKTLARDINDLLAGKNIAPLTWNEQLALIIHLNMALKNGQVIRSS